MLIIRGEISDLVSAVSTVVMMTELGTRLDGEVMTLIEVV